MALSISCWLFYSTYSYASKHNNMISSLEEKKKKKRPGLSRLFSSFVLPPYLEIARPATKSRSSSHMGVCVCWAQVCAARPSRQRIWRWRLNRRRQSSSGKSFFFFFSPSIAIHPNAPACSWHARGETWDACVLVTASYMGMALFSFL